MDFLSEFGNIDGWKPIIQEHFFEGFLSVNCTMNEKHGGSGFFLVFDKV